MVRKASRKVDRYTQTFKSQRQRRTPPAPPARTIRTRSQCITSSTSFFNRLPAEVFHMILDQLSVLEISVFSMVSKEITQCIVDHISTLAWRNKVITQSFHPSTRLELTSTVAHYRNLGLLFKRCTLLLPTKERLKLIFSMFAQIPCFMLEHCLVPDCIGFTSCGVFLQTLIAGWDELECHRVFNFLCEHTNLLPRMEAVITAKPGVRQYKELQLRLFCRRVLLDPWLTEPDCQFWLRQLLRSLPMVSQARLLFILYGPLLPEGSLGWQDVVERVLPHTALWELARTVLLLNGNLQVKGWTFDSMLVVLEELIVIPQPWHLENVARLLVLCGSSLCYTVLASRAVNGRLVEISRLIVYIILVCEKDGYYMSWAVKLVQHICQVFHSAPEKFCFIQHLESMFTEITREFFELSLAVNHLEDRETFQNLCILLDSSARFHTKFLHMLLK
ncbi:putative F-box only protein 47 [Scophthalmus maximus]|uniref:Putative F-box only protein 47 n=1 Tax=Scophthalmus maximus TaxID=52904 RepID=A0A2U9CAX1_SCOMX|nr:F-box only protein 47-like isoform X2 [Scophthalmus maximus]AWP12916.1 putative F-box only protein 47 [Scophthalmus maximus]